MRRPVARGAAVPLLVLLFLGSAWGAQDESEPESVYFWNMSRAIEWDGVGSYDWRVTAVAAQGLVNRNLTERLLFVDIGAGNFDWPKAEQFWVKTLEEKGHAHFDRLGESLCDLVERFLHVFNGIVLYDGDVESNNQYGNG